jgi:stage III sporulation protein AB
LEYGEALNMSLQLLGAILIIAACGGIGFGMALHDRKELTSLRQLHAAAEYMYCELNCHLTALPMLLRNTAVQCDGCLRRYFLLLAEELENQIAPDVYSCVVASLARSNDIPRRTREVLLLMGQGMGQFNLEGQLKELENISAACQRICEQMEVDRPQRLRSYPTLGLCVGGILAILFL